MQQEATTVGVKPSTVVPVLTLQKSFWQIASTCFKWVAPTLLQLHLDSVKNVSWHSLVRRTWDLSCCLQPMAACGLWIPYLYLCICVCICVLDLCRYKIWGKVGPPPTTPCHLGIAPRGKKLPPQCRVSGTHLFDPLSYLFPRTQGGRGGCWNWVSSYFLQIHKRDFFGTLHLLLQDLGNTFYRHFFQLTGKIPGHLQEAGHPSPKMGLSHNQSTRQTGRFLNNPNLTHYRFYQPVVGQPELTMRYSKQMPGQFKSFVHSKR